MKTLDKRAIKRFFKSKYFKLMIQTVLIALYIVVAGEMIIRQDFDQVLDWMNDYSIAFIINVGVTALCLWVMIHIFNSLKIGSFLTIGSITILYLINYFKFDIKGEYVSPLDFNLIGETLNIVTSFKLKITFTIVIIILITIGICFWISRTTFQKMGKKRRGLGGIVGVIGLVLSINVITNNAFLNKIKIQQDVYFVDNNYINNGFLFTLVNRTNEIRVNKPTDYNKETIAQLLDTNAETVAGDIKPNIIMIMSEALFDINQLPNVNLSENPLQNFNKYQEEGVKGNIITPVFGGYTCQTEYEVLTGNSTDFTGTGNIAYTRYVSANTPSIAKELRDIGYNTVGIHPYERTFYRRHAVYEQLGFNEFITQEDFEEPTRIRSYISDQDVFERVIDEYEKNGENPFFTYVVTMQNHGPYTDVNSNADIELLNNTLPEEDTNILSNYASILKQSDQALAYLVEYFRKVEEPTIIVMFGDHLPVLGNAYSNTGYLGQDNLMNAFKQYQTPLLIWSNYQDTQQDIGYIDASYLGAVTLEYVGLNTDTYYKLLLEKAKNIRAYNTGFSVNKEGELISNDQLSSEAIEDLQDLWVLQYDVMFGKNYSNR